jgi:hypothetical protein
MACPPYISSDHTYLHQVPQAVPVLKMPTFHQTDAFAQLRDTVVAELEYLSARGQTLDWWSLGENGEPKIFANPQFAEIRRRLKGEVLDWRDADEGPRAKDKTALFWDEFLGFNWQEHGVFSLKDYADHLLDGFPSAGKQQDAEVRNVFLRLWHNDIYDYIAEMMKAANRWASDLKASEGEHSSRRMEGPYAAEVLEWEAWLRERVDFFRKRTAVARSTLDLLSKISQIYLPAPASAYFSAITENDNDPSLPYNRPVTRKIMIAAMLTEGFPLNLT